MPTVPGYTAPGGAAVYQSARTPNLDVNPTGGLQQGLNSGSTALADIAGRIKAQADDLEFATVKADYDSQVQVIQKDVLTDQSIESPVQEFSDRVTKLQGDVTSRIKSDLVGRAFQKHAASTLPNAQNEIMFGELKIQGMKNVARLNELGDQLSTSAATDTPERRDAAIKDFNEQVDRAEKYGTLTPVQASDKKKEFRITTMTKNMSVMSEQSPYTLFELNRQGVYAEVDPLTKEKILESARVKIEHSDAVREKNFRDAQEVNNRYYGFLANSGAIPQAELEQMLNGAHPYITDPALARTLAHVNANPIAGPSTTVETIMLDYHAGSMAKPEQALANIARARESLGQYRKTMTRRDPALDKAYNELQNDERSMGALQHSQRAEARTIENTAKADARHAETEARIEQSQADKETTTNIRVATELYKTQAPPNIFPGIMGKMKESQRVIDLNEIHGLIRGGMKPQDAVDSVLKKRKESGPPKNLNSNVQDAVNAVGR